MATLASLADDVYILTNRPDLAGETRVSLRKAIFKFHAADTFKRDLLTEDIDLSVLTPVSPDSFVWSIPITDFPRFRRPDYLRIVPHEYGDFTEVSAHDIFDSYRFIKPNIFYISGQALTIRAVCEYQNLTFSYYSYPIVPPVTSDPVISWICDEYPDAVIEEAAGTVFKMIGKDDEASRYQTLFAENVALLRATAVGESV
ncbi:MAG: hypothetical protein ACK5LJ_04215 [Paracoccus sp. (in: a-proteobacteria)]